MRILDIPLENRPRERLEKSGAAVLSDAELLAVILKTGKMGENAIDMSNRLIAVYGLEKLVSCSLNELQQIDGIGKAKACQIIALFELSKRTKMAERMSKPLLTPKDVFEYLSPKMSNLDKEHFVVLHLDSKNRVIKEETLAVGTLNATAIHPREIFKSAIKMSSNAIILAHNHPSGDSRPSKKDIMITNELLDAGKLIDINLFDHVIIGKDSWTSLLNAESQ